MKKKVKFLKSVRTKLFLSLCVMILAIMGILIILNALILKKYYEYTKESQLKEVYALINDYYNNNVDEDTISDELEKVSINNNFDILIKNSENISVYSSAKDFYSSINEMLMSIVKENNEQRYTLEKTDDYIITTVKDVQTNINYIMLYAKLDNSYTLYIRLPVAAIEEVIKIVNRFLSVTAVFIIIVGGTVFFIISRRFSKPIIELNEIAEKMSNLDFSQKYKTSNSNDEIDMLGLSINELSTKLETTIKQLRNTNTELEKDIEEKSQIDEMRKSFISDVSHELKTPIALIQGYSEGLIENVNDDEESRKFYAEVILDEAAKMDVLVKRLLELMKLEYGRMQFNNKEFDIVELENEIIRKSQVLIERENIILECNLEGECIVYADDFYIDQVFTNYITNAIRYAEEINGKKQVKVVNEIKKDENKIRIKVFNTFGEFSEEDMLRIWNRFYKSDESRTREKGGNGIGLALVKAIMNNYGNEYGVKNVAGGVEFYFELDIVSNEKKLL